jgi:hypothetical protein
MMLNMKCVIKKIQRTQIYNGIIIMKQNKQKVLSTRLATSQTVTQLRNHFACMCVGQ